MSFGLFNSVSATSVTICLLLACAASAADGKVGSPLIDLGTVRQYPDEATAHAACPSDGVVWVDTKTGFYYPKFFAEYGHTPHGAYACYKEAEKANYWSVTPATDGGHKGREFPLFFCYSCS